MPPSEAATIETEDALRRLAYLSGLLLILVPFLQATSQIWPLQFSNIQWRFAAANALSSVLILPFCGLALLVAGARAGAKSGMLRFLGALAALMTLLLLSSLVVFVLDAFQLKAIVTTKAMSQFVGASLRVGVATLIFASAFGMLTMVAFKKATPDSLAQRKGGKKADEGVGLIVGQGAPTAE